jgi:hypothetical protein
MQKISKHTGIDQQTAVCTTPKPLLRDLKALLWLPFFAWALLRGADAQPEKYTTSFPLTENPISERGHWINGGMTHLDWLPKRLQLFPWRNVRTARGLAFGTESGYIVYDDSIAILAGTWRPTQTVTATVRTTNRVARGDDVLEEVETLLRFSISARRATGYEIMFAVTPFHAYVAIARWNGPFGDFTMLASNEGVRVSDGDVVTGTISGATISARVNGVQVLSVDDIAYSSGSPGIGFYYLNQKGIRPYAASDYGFSNFSASSTAGPGSATITIPNVEPRRQNLAADIYW